MRFDESNVARVERVLQAARFSAATRTHGGWRAWHVQGTTGDVAVTAVGVGARAYLNGRYAEELSKAFPRVPVVSTLTATGQQIVVRFDSANPEV